MSPAATVAETPFRRVSIVVVAGASPDDLVRCVTSLATLRFRMVAAPAVDVVIVADDAVADRLDADSLAAVSGREVRVATVAGGAGEAIAVGLGMRHPDAEVVAFLEADRIVVPTWLDHHLATLVAHDADVSVGPQLLRLPAGDATAGIAGAGSVMRRSTGTRQRWATAGNVVVRVAATGSVDIDRRLDVAADALADWTFRLGEDGARLVWADRAVVWRRATATQSHQPVGARSEDARSETPGLRWRGPVMGWSGYGELARGLITGAERAGLVCAVETPGAGPGPSIDDLGADTGELIAWARRFGDGRRLPTVLVGLPVAADGFDVCAYLAEHEAALPHAALTMCETEVVHPSWVPALERMDRVWVPSQFCVDAFVAGGVDRNRLRVLRPGVQPTPEPVRTVRASDDPFTFLIVAARDPRKNLPGTVAAFAEAFRGDTAARLVIKTTPPIGGQRSTREQVDEYLAGLGGPTPEVEVIETLVPDARLERLMADADAFVLASFGEAVGLPYLHALMRGLPVVATGWGGQCEFLDDDVAFPVDVDGLAAVPADVGAWAPHLAGLRWARPSHDHLVEQFRRVRGWHADALARARLGRERMLSDWTVEAAGRRVRALAEELTTLGPGAACSLPATTVPDEPATVVWTGLVYGANSFAVEGRDYVLGLARRGVAIGLDPAPGPGPGIELEPATRALLARLRLRRPGSRWVDVQHAQPGALDPRAGAVASVGRTMWETEGLPPERFACCRAMTELWLPSTPTAEMFVRAGLDPAAAVVIPEIVDDRYFDAPADFVFPERRARTLLSVFDWQYRKGWDVLLAAYAMAFSAGDDVQLCILTHSMLRYSRTDIVDAAQAAMRSVRSHDLPTLHFLDGPVPEASMPGLFASADVYVLPTRGEGWGRPFASAMAANTLVVATDAGGHRHFADDETALLVPSRLVDVADHAGIERPEYAGLRWNEPDPEALAVLLRDAVEGDHQDRVRRARRCIEAFRHDAVIDMLVQRLTLLEEQS